MQPPVPTGWKWDKARSRYRVPVGDQWKVAHDIDQGIELILAHRLEGAQAQPPARVTFATVATRWLDGRAKRPGTGKVDRMAVRHLVGYFGERDVAEIRPSDVAAWLAKRSAQVGAGHVRNQRQRLVWIMDLAVDDRLRDDNPCRTASVKRAQPRYKAAKQRLVTDREVEAVRAAAIDVIADGLLVSWATGMRPSEVFGLTAPFVLGLGQGGVQPLGGVPLVQVRWQLANERERGSTQLLADVKTGAGERDIPIAHVLRPMLTRRVERARLNMVRPGATPAQSAGLLFLGQRGAAVWDTKAQTEIAKAAERAGFHVTWKALRHQMASRLLVAGCDIKTVQALIGHESLGTEHLTNTVTVDVYAHASTSPAEQLEWIEKGLRYPIGTHLALVETNAQVSGVKG